MFGFLYGLVALARFGTARTAFYLGLAVGMLTRGADVRLEPGTSIEMEIQREVTVDASRVSARREVIVRND